MSIRQIIKNSQFWLAVCIIFLLAFATASFIYLQTFQFKKNPEKSIIKEESKFSLSFMGKIQDVKGNTISFKALKANNPSLLNDRFYQVSVNSQTKIISYKNRNVKIQISPEKEIVIEAYDSAGVFDENEATIININDLKAGGAAIVIGWENLKEVDFFVAKEIILLN